MAAGLPLPSRLAALLLVVVPSLTVAMAHGRWAVPAGLVMLLLTGAAANLLGFVLCRPTYSAPATSPWCIRSPGSPCMLEATMGQFLPTVLIARVATMAMRQDER